MDIKFKILQLVWLATFCGLPADTNATVSNTNNYSEDNIQDFIEHQTSRFMYMQPILSTSMDVDPHLVGGDYNQRLPDYSSASMKRVQQLMFNASQTLSKADLSNASSDKQRHVAILSEIGNYYAGYKYFPAGYIDSWAGHLPYIVNQLIGPLIDIPKEMQARQRLKSKTDARAYIERLHAFPLMVEQVMQKVRQDNKDGVLLPAKLFPKTLQFLTDFIASTADKHPLVTSFVKRLDSIDTLTKMDKSLLIKQTANAVEDCVFPAYRKVLNLMKELQPKASYSDGVWAQRGGKEFYLHRILYQADSQKSAREIHNIGLNEVDRIATEMNEILTLQGLKLGTVGERMAELATEQRFLYQNSDKGREELLANLRKNLKNAQLKAHNWFATIPEQQVEIHRIPELMEPGAPAGDYSAPSIDGERPAIFSINLRDMSSIPRFTLKTLTFHETIPGHHLQLAINMTQKNTGLLRKIAPFNAFAEGWALYSEALAYEMGLYKGDPWGNLGRLQAELYRAVRLVVDTGIHSKKWSREKAIDYFHRITGTPISIVAAEVERYMALPGQALGYQLGMLEFNQLRKKSLKALGKKFDLKAFHDVLLIPGARPMSIVRADVQRWIESH